MNVKIKPFSPYHSCDWRKVNLRIYKINRQIRTLNIPIKFFQYRHAKIHTQLYVFFYCLPGVITLLTVNRYSKNNHLTFTEVHFYNGIFEQSRPDSEDIQNNLYISYALLLALIQLFEPFDEFIVIKPITRQLIWVFSVTNYLDSRLVQLFLFFFLLLIMNYMINFKLTNSINVLSFFWFNLILKMAKTII